MEIVMGGRSVKVSRTTNHQRARNHTNSSVISPSITQNRQRSESSGTGVSQDKPRILAGTAAAARTSAHTETANDEVRIPDQIQDDQMTIVDSASRNGQAEVTSTVPNSANSFTKRFDQSTSQAPSRLPYCDGRGATPSMSLAASFSNEKSPSQTRSPAHPPSLQGPTVFGVELLVHGKNPLTPPFSHEEVPGTIQLTKEKCSHPAQEHDRGTNHIARASENNRWSEKPSTDVNGSRSARRAEAQVQFNASMTTKPLYLQTGSSRFLISEYASGRLLDALLEGRKYKETLNKSSSEGRALEDDLRQTVENLNRVEKELSELEPRLVLGRDRLSTAEGDQLTHLIEERKILLDHKAKADEALRGIDQKFGMARARWEDRWLLVNECLDELWVDAQILEPRGTTGEMTQNQQHTAHPTKSHSDFPDRDNKVEHGDLQQKQDLHAPKNSRYMIADKYNLRLGEVWNAQDTFESYRNSYNLEFRRYVSAHPQRPEVDLEDEFARVFIHTTSLLARKLDEAEKAFLEIKAEAIEAGFAEAYSDGGKGSIDSGYHDVNLLNRVSIQRVNAPRIENWLDGSRSVQEVRDSLLAESAPSSSSDVELEDTGSTATTSAPTYRADGSHGESREADKTEYLGENQVNAEVRQHKETYAGTDNKSKENERESMESGKNSGKEEKSQKKNCQEINIPPESFQEKKTWKNGTSEESSKDGTHKWFASLAMEDMEAKFVSELGSIGDDLLVESPQELKIEQHETIVHDNASSMVTATKVVSSSYGPYAKHSGSSSHNHDQTTDTCLGKKITAINDPIESTANADRKRKREDDEDEVKEAQSVALQELFEAPAHIASGKRRKLIDGYAKQWRGGWY